jgi:proteasome accessory factor B
MMPRNNQIARVLAVARALAATKRGVNLKALAEKNRWSWRTVYRDVAALESAGFPIANEAGKYWLLEGWSGPQQASASPDELLALFVARSASLGWRTTSLGRALERLWMKLTTGATGQLALLPATQAPWLTVRAPSGVDYGAHSKTIATLERAIAGKIVVNCRYRAMSTSQITARTIEPGELYWDPGLETLYLIAWCRMRQAVRIFAIQRFLVVTLMSESFVPRPGVHSKAALKSAFRVWRSGTVEEIRVYFSPQIAEEIRGRTWGSRQKLWAQKDGGVILSIEVAGTAEVERWVASYGGDARVLAPASLAAAVRARHLDGLRTSGSSPERSLSSDDKSVA